MQAMGAPAGRYCGSPLETEAGWLVLTHGVRPMRRDTLSALLLDLADRRWVIGHLPVPLLAPDETERERYVPNVLHSCGGLINGDALVLPYGFSDHGINIALISVPECWPSRGAPRFEWRSGRAARSSTADCTHPSARRCQ